MANSVGVRTAAGGLLSLSVTPADVIGRCDQCLRTYREGDWYCAHLAAAHGHQVARLSDQDTSIPADVISAAAAQQTTDAPPAAFTVSFRH